VHALAWAHPSFGSILAFSKLYPELCLYQGLTDPWRVSTSLYESSCSTSNTRMDALAWAHPSFGSILASCSFDGKVFIWKENDGPQKPELCLYQGLTDPWRVSTSLYESSCSTSNTRMVRSETSNHLGIH
jgi:WD40 repeat protein